MQAGVQAVTVRGDGRSDGLLREAGIGLEFGEERKCRLSKRGSAGRDDLAVSIDAFEQDSPNFGEVAATPKVVGTHFQLLKQCP